MATVPRWESLRSRGTIPQVDRSDTSRLPRLRGAIPFLLARNWDEQLSLRDEVATKRQQLGTRKYHQGPAILDCVTA